MSDSGSENDLFSETDTQSASSASKQSNSDSERTDNEGREESSDEDGPVIEPYLEEPLAPPGQIEEEANQTDQDGLSPDTLAQREDGTIALAEWCKCEHCRTDNLNGALEYRCCREVVHTQGKMMFDGSIETLKCITQHEDYNALTNKAVLENVGPLLKTKNGRAYRRRAGVLQNEYLRAVAYRWTIRWFCGYMGWDNTRPLPSCIYEDIRTRYQTRHLRPRGYRDAQ